MKARRLIFCLLLSVMFTATFIPTIAFGYGDDGQYSITVNGSHFDEDTYSAVIDGGGSVSGLAYDEDTDNYYCYAGGTVCLYIYPIEGKCAEEVHCYRQSDNQSIDVSYDEEGDCWSFTMPDDNVYIDVTFGSTINQYGSVEVEGWVKDAEDNELWHSQTYEGAYLRIGCEEATASFEDEYTHVKIGSEVWLEVGVPDGRVTGVTWNGKNCYDEEYGQYKFTVAADTVTEANGRTPGNKLAVTLEPIFEDLTEDEMASAVNITVDQEKVVNTEGKTTTFKFVPEVSGKYVFYSTDYEDSEYAGDPHGRVLDAAGNVLAEGYDEQWAFIIYFDAEAGQTYYLQACDYYGDSATYAVGLIENDITGITYIPKGGKITLRQGIDTYTEETYDSDENPIQVEYWNTPSICELGDKIILTKKGGSEITYECKNYEENDDWGFVNTANDEDTLTGWPHLQELESDWATLEDTPIGSTKQLEVSYAGHTTMVTVEFAENPFTGLEIVSEDGPKVEYVSGAEYSSGDEFYKYMWDFSGVTFRLTARDGSTVDYVMPEDSQDTNTVINQATGETLSLAYDDSYKYYDADAYEYLNWQVGSSYDSYIKIAGFKADVTVPVVNHVHNMVWKAKEPANCCNDGTIGHWYCTRCFEDYYDKAGTQRYISEDLAIPQDDNAHKWHTYIDPATLWDNGYSYQECEYCYEWKNEKTIYSPETYKFAATTYNGYSRKPTVTIRDTEGNKIASSNYTVTYSNNVNAGSNAKAYIKFKNNYTGSITKTFTISKAANTLKASAKTATVKYSKVKKSAQKLKKSKVMSVSKAKGTLKYIKVSGSNRLSISKTTGKVTVKKKTKKGTYKMKVKVKAAGTSNYKSGSKTIKIVVKVK